MSPISPSSSTEELARLITDRIQMNKKELKSRQLPPKLALPSSFLTPVQLFNQPTNTAHPSYTKAVAKAYEYNNAAGVLTSIKKHYYEY
jgi:hypothetical protein